MARKKRQDDTPTGRPLSPTSRRRALLICNGSFKYLDLALPGVAKDATHLSQALGDPERAGFEVTCLLDEGLWAVRKAIAKACDESGPDDTLLLYYSGTSTCDAKGELMMPVADSDGDYLLATCIESDFVLSQMRRSRCRRFVLVIDGCHSGAFFRNNRGIPDGMVAITSCSADEFSMDTAEGGAFTQSFLRALVTPEADADHDGSVTVDEVYEFVRRDPVLAGESAAHPQKWLWNLPEPIVLVRTTMCAFLSYSRNDAAVADDVTAALHARGIAVWRDISGIAGGAQWRDSLLEAFGKSQALVLLMSAKSMESKWVRRELEYADGKGLPVFPLLLDRDLKVPDWFELQFGGVQRQTVDVADVGTAVATLASTIRAAVATPRPVTVADADSIPGTPLPVASAPQSRS
jgi:hypothetical protein